MWIDDGPAGAAVDAVAAAVHYEFGLVMVSF